MNLLYGILIGALAGWLAGKLTSGRGFGILMNIVIGVIGSVIGHVLFGFIQLPPQGRLGELIVATVGALVLLAVVNAIAKRR